MSDHDGHTVAVGPVTVGIDTAAFRQGHRRLAREGVCLMCGFWPCPVRRLCDEVDRLRDENTALAAALEDIAGIEKWNHSDPPWRATGECASYLYPCHVQQDDDPDEWCPVCVAEVAWCAWKMGVLA